MTQFSSNTFNNLVVSSWAIGIKRNLRMPIILILFFSASGCTTLFPIIPVDQSVPLALLPTSAIGIEDKRARFREIFCTVLQERGDSLADYRSCDQALQHLDTESAGEGEPVNLGFSKYGLTAIVIPGVGWDCFDEWLDTHYSIESHINKFGYNLKMLKVEGLSSSIRNAELIHDAVIALPELRNNHKLVLIGYSKGANDILEALVAYPKLHTHIAAVVSIAGAIGGSPLAEDAEQTHLSLLTKWPGAKCTNGDAGAIESLRPSVRQAWLSRNSLPDGIPYFSLVSLPEPERVSVALKSSYNRLRLIDSRNDGQLLFFDQVIPRSSLLGYLNADHWAIAVPIARSHQLIGTTFADQNDFPREALYEAILRFVEEDLDASPTN